MLAIWLSNYLFIVLTIPLESVTPQDLGKVFLIRHALEKKIVIDNKLCLPKLRFNQCAQISPYVKEKFGKYKYICFMLWSLKFSRSCHSVFLTGYRIMRLCLKK